MNTINPDRLDWLNGLHLASGGHDAVQGVKTGIVEGLHGALRSVLTCPSTDEHGHACIGSVCHETSHWDGNGCNWHDDGIANFIGGES